ncbi:tripartite tricarboxylate transporter permease [Clostridium sp. AM58-1XD]|uniref:tripartite tricarboxylate transporter permease n=1 Tax=Clostridium sp. AM58-1XD TaxID=2292307 RepID=UPI001FA823A9|nr:tripartite tricarboxylate transporter permease [Clostridium sp. AM58-1XD]
MQLIQGFITIFHPTTLFLIIGGVIGGIVFGAIPGLSAFTALALFLPITFGMEPVNGIAFLISIYVGGLSGGLISAVLLGIPGTPSSIATCFDGYPMAQKGEAGKALGTAIVFSFVGGIFGALVLIYLGPVIAGVALKFGPYEYFAVILFALTTVSGLSAGNINKGLLSCLFGIMMSFVGIDRLSSYTRYTFGIDQLSGGFNLVPLLIGTFAVSQIIETAAKGPSAIQKAPSAKIKGFGISLKEFMGQMKNAIPAAIIGLAIGILPGIGGNASNLMAYAFCKKRSKYPEKFGTGVIDGIVASETANNATIGGALIVLLTLGIPGDNATSMVLAGFQIHSITPGPLLFKTSGALVYALLAAFIIANIVMMVSELIGLPLFAKVLSIPGSYLLPVVIAFCFVGSFSANNRIFDILVMVIFGLIGYVLKRHKFPLAPMVVGFILAPLLEENVRRSLMRTEGRLLPILSSPIALVFYPDDHYDHTFRQE